MTQKVKSIIMRFIKGFVSGGLGNIVVLASFAGSSWKDLGTWLSAIGFSFIVGGISGVLLGAEKWLNWTDESVG